VQKTWISGPSAHAAEEAAVANGDVAFKLGVALRLAVKRSPPPGVNSVVYNALCLRCVDHFYTVFSQLFLGRIQILTFMRDIEAMGMEAADTENTAIHEAARKELAQGIVSYASAVLPRCRTACDVPLQDILSDPGRALLALKAGMGMSVRPHLFKVRSVSFSCRHLT
jgi:hypothetical protein